MVRVRMYGEPPYDVAVLHGGPGAPGSVAPVARELGRVRGALEPLQSAPTIAGQVEELREVLEVHARLPVALIGHSWGAWLGFVFAARHPAMVRKLVLVGSGPFEEKYARGILETRLARLGADDRREARDVLRALDGGGPAEGATFARFGALMAKADACDPLPEEREEALDFQPDVHAGVAVWREASALRRGGALLDMASDVRCPVVAIHGDHDPHPAAGVEEPLRSALKDFRFLLLERCGHEPWNERHARERFHEILREEARP